MTVQRRLAALGLALGAGWSPAAAQHPHFDLGSFGGGRSGGRGGDLGGVGINDLFAGLMGGTEGRGGGGARNFCKDGQVPVPKEDNHKEFSANGCGPQGLRIDENHGLFRCCNFHDVCFSVCGTTHEWCEKQFEKCMRRVCKNPASGEKQACKEQAKSFSDMTKLFGSGFHSTSQKASCTCVDKDQAHSTHRTYLTSFLKDYNETAAEEENVSQLLDRFKNKEGEMYALLTIKYGHRFVKFDGVDPVIEAFRKDEL